jgi:hypothetical protein
MKTKQILMLGLLSIILMANRCESKKAVQSLFKDDCPLSYKVEWTIVEDGIAVDKQIELLSKLSAAAQADANELGKLVGEGSAEAKFENTFQLTKAIQSETVRKAQVSQDVFDEFVKVRTASCNIWDAIQGGIYGDDEQAIKEARALFTSIQAKFSELEKKKLQ